MSKERNKPRRDSRSYIGWAFFQCMGYGIVRRKFAFVPIKTKSKTAIWLKPYYVFYTQEYGTGLHSGWFWNKVGNFSSIWELRSTVIRNRYV